MVIAKAISLSVHPTQSADLCYPISGIIEYQSENLLGRTVNAYDLVGYKEALKPAVELPSPWLTVGTPGPGNPPLSGIGALGQLQPIGDTPSQIESDLGRSVLSRLRAKDVATNLTQALAWYGLKNSADLSSEAVHRKSDLLGKAPSDPNSLPALLSSLSKVLKKRHDTLASLYQGEQVETITAPTSTSISSSQTTGGQSFHTDSTTTTTYGGQEFHAPVDDNTARYLRAEIALRQERLAAFRLVKLNSADNVDYAKAMTAADIRKIQLEYLDTFIVAPFDGMITAVFRNVGEFVAAGQPVMRLENDRAVYLVGQLKCRGLVRVGYKAHVSTTLFGEAGATPVEIDGMVCAIRGHEPADEQWNVVIRCNNEAAGGRVLPLNYNFDYDSTDISIEA